MIITGSTGRKPNVSYILPGYFITNKPKYFPGDTVKMKAFLVKTEGGYYNRPLTLYLSDLSRNTMAKDGYVKPVTKGAYVSEFVISDTLKLDWEYQLFVERRRRRGGEADKFSGWKIIPSNEIRLMSAQNKQLISGREAAGSLSVHWTLTGCHL